MKKLIFLGLSVTALAGCSSSISNSNQLVGNWHCTINYDDFNIQTIDNLTFSVNGHLLNRGTVNYPIKKPILVYSVQQNGRWNLDKNKIVYRIASETLQRQHSQSIWTELQRDTEMQQFEENLFSSLSSDSYKAIELTITDFNDDEMDIKQEISGHKSYKGLCIKQ